MEQAQQRPGLAVGPGVAGVVAQAPGQGCDQDRHGLGVGGDQACGAAPKDWCPGAVGVDFAAVLLLAGVVLGDVFGYSAP